MLVAASTPDTHARGRPVVHLMVMVMMKAAVVARGVVVYRPLVRMMRDGPGAFVTGRG